MDKSLKAYIKILKDSGEKFPAKAHISKHRDEIWAAFRKLQYLNCLYKWSPDVEEFMNEISVLVNDIENERPPKATIIPSAFGSQLGDTGCLACGCKETIEGPESGGWKQCKDCGAV